VQLKNTVEVGDVCLTDYIYWPLSSNKRLVFSEVTSLVQQGDVLDLGCGEAGVYWALGYADKARSLSFVDINKEHIKNTHEQIERLSPDYLSENFEESVDWLIEKNIIPSQGLDEVAINIIEKVDAVSVFDYQTESLSKAYDTVLCVESLHIADTQSEFNAQVEKISHLIKPGGNLVGISWRHNAVDANTQNLIHLKYDGQLNPDQEAFKEAFDKANLKIIELKTVSTPDINNYHEAIIFHVTKGGNQ